MSTQTTSQTEHRVERQAELRRIILLIENLSKNPDYQQLKEAVFDKSVGLIEKQLKKESEKNKLDDTEIYRLQGKLEWAKRYSDVYKLAETYKLELNQLTKNLNENV